MWRCDRCKFRFGPHVVGFHEHGVHKGEMHLCDPCFRWALNAGHIEEPYIDPDEYDRRTMPQDNCDTGRRIHASKGAAEADDKALTGADKGHAERCNRCKGWHASSDRPKSRRAPTRRQRTERR